MIYFTADLHLGHNAIIQMQDRPFSDLAEMNQALIANINHMVHKDDSLYILGDIAHHISFEERNELVRQIKCRNKYLLLGNHDFFGGKTNYDENLFVWVKDYSRESFSGTNIVMMHYPLMSWDRMRRGSIMLHGHIHSSGEYNRRNIMDGIRRFDVGVDANGYCPVPITKVLEWATEAGANDPGRDYHER